MFNTSTHYGSRKPAALAYRDVDTSTALDGASPHKLVSLLYATLAGQIANARGALARRDIAEKGRAIGHAVRIVEEGLRAPLDLRAGGAIAANLHDLYEYMLHRLTLANANNDDAALNECARLVDTLRQGWDGMADAVRGATPVAA
ncbi:MAG: flagellar export chaperone FliS [Burkholderiales bacterium]|nr:flagellar export chaperone FliS [Burkholderiales bacterium]